MMNCYVIMTPSSKDERFGQRRQNTEPCSSAHRCMSQHLSFTTDRLCDISHISVDCTETLNQPRLTTVELHKYTQHASQELWGPAGWVAWKCVFSATFLQAVLTGKVGQCDQGSLVGLRMQDYKSLCAAVMICASLINIQTHTETDSILTSLYEQLNQLS